MGRKIDLPSILRIRKSNPTTTPISEKRSSTPSTGGSGNLSGRPSKDEVQIARPGSGQSAGSRTGSNDTIVTLSGAAIKKRTQLRRNFAISASVSYALSIIFLILVSSGPYLSLGRS